MKKRVLSLLLVAAMIISVCACGQTGAPAVQTGEQSLPTSEPEVNTDTGSGLKDGTFSGVAQGFGGTVKVEVIIKNGVIADIIAQGDSETAGIGSMAIEQLPEKIKAAKGVDVDTVSGATYTSNAVIEATKDALLQAGGVVVAAGKPQDGKYTVKAIGHEGTVVVAVMFVDGKIQSVTIPSNNETVGVGTYAVEQIPSRIVEAQSVNVDVVTGASITSNTIKQAVAAAIKEAGGDLNDFSSEPAAAAKSSKTVTEEVDVVIMGAGTAGIFAAARLMENGVKNVLLFEKTSIPGGSMALTYGGIVLTDSEIFANWGMGREKETYYGNFEENLRPVYTNDTNKAIYGKEEPELDWLSQMYKTAGSLYDWMANIGIGFMTIGSKSGYNYPYFAPGCYEGGAGYAMEFLVDRITYQGAKIVYDTPVVDLKADENGNITGLIAQGKDGTTYDITAKATLLASGSFAKNKDLLEEYFPEWADFYFGAPESTTGDGLILGMKYGAGIEYMGAHMPGYLATYDSHFELAFMHLTTPGIIVNINGDQFGNITRSNHSVMAAAKRDKSNGDTFYFVFDEAAAEQTKNYDAYGFDTYEGIFEKGEAMYFDSVEAAAHALSLPNLTATVNTNNVLSLKGEEDEWGRKSLPYIDERDGIWVVRVDPNPYLTTGGLSVDIDARVLTDEGKVIKGLYAAGDIIGSYEQRDGALYGYGFDAAMTFGTVAADTMTKVIK